MGHRPIWDAKRFVLCWDAKTGLLCVLCVVWPKSVCCVLCECPTQSSFLVFFKLRPGTAAPGGDANASSVCVQHAFFYTSFFSFFNSIHVGHIKSNRSLDETDKYEDANVKALEQLLLSWKV
jgi:hypothetical protein